MFKARDMLFKVAASISDLEYNVEFMDKKKGAINIALDKLVNGDTTAADYNARRLHLIDERDKAEAEWKQAKDEYHEALKKNRSGGYSFSAGKGKKGKSSSGSRSHNAKNFSSKSLSDSLTSKKNNTKKSNSAYGTYNNSGRGSMKSSSKDFSSSRLSGMLTARKDEPVKKTGYGVFGGGGRATTHVYDSSKGIHVPPLTTMEKLFGKKKPSYTASSGGYGNIGKEKVLRDLDPNGTSMKKLVGGALVGGAAYGLLDHLLSDKDD